jgi:hypothetical protein
MEYLFMDGKLNWIQGLILLAVLSQFVAGFILTSMPDKRRPVQQPQILDLF